MQYNIITEGRRKRENANSMMRMRGSADFMTQPQKSPPCSAAARENNQLSAGLPEEGYYGKI